MENTTNVAIGVFAYVKSWGENKNNKEPGFDNFSSGADNAYGAVQGNGYGSYQRQGNDYSYVFNLQARRAGFRPGNAYTEGSRFSTDGRSGTPYQFGSDNGFGSPYHANAYSEGSCFRSEDGRAWTPYTLGSYNGVGNPYGYNVGAHDVVYSGPAAWPGHSGGHAQFGNQSDSGHGCQTERNGQYGSAYGSGYATDSHKGNGYEAGRSTGN